MKTLSIIFLALLSLLSKNQFFAQVTGFYPSWGYPGQIIKVEGTGLGNPTISWDGRSIPTASSSGVYFQIPRDAEARNHRVELLYGSGGSGINIFNVHPLPGSIWPGPRIEDVAIRYFAPDASRVELTVSIANGDVNARIKVSMLDDVGPLVICDPCATEFQGAISTDRFNNGGHNSETYRFPVYHYTSLKVIIVPLVGTGRRLIFGRTLVVEVFNSDGSSSFKDYKTLNRMIELDSDNDGLLDTWEISGYPRPSDPESTIDLRGMGCNPYRKDILVEVDWMLSALPGSFISVGHIWERISEVYLNAPVLNPDGSSGIHLHIDRGQDIVSTGSPSRGPFIEGNSPVSDVEYLEFGDRPLRIPSSDYRDFCYIKSNWFGHDRDSIFHYCVIGNARPNRSSGRAESPGNGFIVTTAGLPNPELAGSVEAMIGSFVHELGHNLGLHHGGIITDPPLGSISMGPYDWQLFVLDTFKPNQPSSMNYRYCLKGISRDCDLCSDVPAIHGYSEGMLHDINERDVNERVGICNNRSIDFRYDNILEVSVNVNTNGAHPPGADPALCIGHARSFDTDITDVFHDYDEWGNLQLNWRASRLFQSPPRRWWWGCR